MRGLIVIAGLMAVAVAACDRPVPVALNAPPPTPYAAPYQYPPPPAAQYPPPPAQYPPTAQYPPPPAQAQYPPPVATMPAPQNSTTVAEPASNATCFTGPGLPLCVPADQIWYKSATEWYNPSTYCKWGRQQLPERLQKVCSELDQKYPPRKISWKRFEADNGAVYVMDMNSISHMQTCAGCADATICTVDNNQCIPPNMRAIRFDCRGHYLDIMSRGDLQMAPPRSVIGQMAAVACVAPNGH
jgi:hypothetical protein